MKFASIIIPTWNGLQLISACLDALLEQDYSDFEIIVVDDASTDGTADWVAKQYPQITLICHPVNLGFCHSCNSGLEQAKGDILILLNHDTEVLAGWLAELVAILTTDSAIGIAGGKALYPDGLIQHAGGYIDERGVGDHYGYLEEDDGRFDQAKDVDFITGATLAITREAYEAVGNLDIGFSPAYYEDVDLCYRVRAAGWRVVYAPKAVLIHKEVSVLIDDSYEAMYHFNRNRLRLVLKHWSIERLQETFVEYEKAAIDTYKDGQQLRSALQNAYLYQLSHLNDLAHWRRQLHDSSDGDIDSLIASILSLRIHYPHRSTNMPTPALEIDPPPPLPDLSPLPELPPLFDSATLPPLPDFPKFILPPFEYEHLSYQHPEGMDDIHDHKIVQEQPFESQIPFIGGLIAGFRRQWNRISTEWYVRPMLAQQNQFNQSVVSALTDMHQLIRDYCEQFNRNQAQNQAIYQRQIRLYQQVYEQTYEHLEWLHYLLKLQHQQSRQQVQQAQQQSQQLSLQVQQQAQQVQQQAQQALQQSQQAQLQVQHQSQLQLQEQFQQQLQEMETILIEYIRENNREIAGIAQKLQND